MTGNTAASGEPTISAILSTIAAIVGRDEGFRLQHWDYHISVIRDCVSLSLGRSGRCPIAIAIMRA